MKERRVVVAIGNTNCKAAVLRGLDVLGAPMILETATLTQEALERALWSLQAAAGTTTVLCSVVPSASLLVEAALRGVGAAAALRVEASRVDWMQVVYTPTNALGADRLCSILGVREVYGAPAIVVDFGTATTFNVIDDDGDFAGGSIAPGITASFRALHGETAQLPLLHAKEWTRMPPLFGRNTEDSIAAGVLWSAWLAVRGMVEEASKGFRNPARVVLTGGAAPLFAGIADADWVSDEHVLLKGAACFAMRCGRGG